MDNGQGHAWIGAHLLLETDHQFGGLMRIVLSAVMVALALAACGNAHGGDNRTGDGLPAAPSN